MPPLSEFPSPREDDTGNEIPLLRVPPPGPQSKSAVLRLERVECPAFGQRRGARSDSADVDMTPIVLSSGKGSNAYDVDGNRYVDLAAGFGSLLLGHGATAVARALEAQSDRMIQALGDVFSGETKIALLERLAKLHPGSNPRVLLGQSGSDAVTAAIKTAKLATGRPGICAFDGAYHGLGYAPLAGCGYRESYRASFSDQLNPHVRFAPYPRTTGDLDRALTSVENCLRGGEIGAVLVEPILGRGGCVVPPDSFMHGLCEVAHRQGALVIADEIWTGLGRSGAMVRSVELGAAIDILCFGKGLGGGLPISACIAQDDVMQAWARDEEIVHTSTHSGWPLACATAVATLDSIKFQKLVVRAAEIGGRVLAALAESLLGAPGVVDVRGAGMMIGVELSSAAVATKASRGLLGKGYIVVTGGLRGEVLTLTPPLTISEALFRELGPSLREVLGG